MNKLYVPWSSPSLINSSEHQNQWNTYGDPPNSVLLCGFGHVDYIPLPAHLYGEDVRGNPGDVVEIRADIVVKQALETRTDSVQENYVHERIDWWLEEGGDEYVFFGCVIQLR